MPEDINDNIENLSKLAAENFSTEDMAPSWNSIEKLLNSEMPVKDRKRRFILFFFLIAVVLLGGMFLYTQKAIFKADKNVTAKQNTDLPAENNRIPSYKIQDTPSTKSTAQTIGTISLNKSSKQFTQKQTSTSLIQNKNNISEADVINREHLSDSVEIQKINENNIADNNNQFPNRRNAENYTTGVKEITKEQYQKNIEASIATTQLTSNSPDSFVVKNKQTAISAESRGQQGVDENKIPKKKKLPGRFSVAALYGKNFSAVNFTADNKPGSDIGILMGYEFSKRWSARSGIIFSTKEYMTDGYNFQLDVSKLSLPSYNTLELKEVNALSHIVEVPFNISYSFNPLKQNRFFISGGISAYFTKREDIDYNILLDGNKQIEIERVYDAGEEENSHFIAGSFNFSGGYHFTLNNRFSFEIEPFAKLPIAKVGVGNIKLMSFGIFAAISFKPFNKKNNHAK